MAHEIMANDNMMYVGKRPWHGLGTEVLGAATAHEALLAADLNWEVEKRDLFTTDARSVIQVPSHKAIVRVDTNEPLGVATSRYHCIQNEEQFALMDAVVGSKEAKYHTAGSLQNGRLVWMLAQLNETLNIAGKDAVEQYLLLHARHDGTGSVAFLYTPVRVVCANTLQAALQNAKVAFRIRHTSGYKAKIQEAREALGFAHKYFDAFAEAAERMAKAPFTQVQMEALAAGLFPSKIVDGEEVTSTKAKNSRDKMLELYEDGAGIAPFRGTAWAAFNAVAEYTDHHRTARGGDEGRLASVWFGSSATMKQRAFGMIEAQLTA